MQKSHLWLIRFDWHVCCYLHRLHLGTFPRIHCLQSLLKCLDHRCSMQWLTCLLFLTKLYSGVWLVCCSASLPASVDCSCCYHHQVPCTWRFNLKRCCRRCRFGARSFWCLGGSLFRRIRRGHASASCRWWCFRCNICEVNKRVCAQSIRVIGTLSWDRPYITICRQVPCFMDVVGVHACVACQWASASVTVTSGADLHMSQHMLCKHVWAKKHIQ